MRKLPVRTLVDEMMWKKLRGRKRLACLCVSGQHVCRIDCRLQRSGLTRSRAALLSWILVGRVAAADVAARCQ